MISIGVPFSSMASRRNVLTKRRKGYDLSRKLEVLAGLYDAANNTSLCLVTKVMAVCPALFHTPSRSG